jgi:hypothetical protein
MLMLGSRVWLYRDHQSYTKPRRECWEELTVTGETTRSWLVRCSAVDIKVPKSHKEPTFPVPSHIVGYAKLAFSRQIVEDDVWRAENKRELFALIERADTATLRKVAELVGYYNIKPKPAEEKR